VAVPNQGQQAVFSAAQIALNRLPFALPGIDSDSGCRFINDHVHRYTHREPIALTPSRPYQKNDKALIEQKDRSVVHSLAGHELWLRLPTNARFNRLTSWTTSRRTRTWSTPPSIQPL
jgi:hypothetical protein